jgi:protein TonB
MMQLKFILFGTVGLVTSLSPLLAQEVIELKEPVAPVHSEQANEATVYRAFELNTQPEFPGGLTAMNDYIATTMKYPKRAIENAVQGTVLVSFIVEKDGSLTDIQVVRDIGSNCGKEAIRLVEGMPKWTPGAIDGKAVRTKITTPFKFKLE